MCAFPRKFFCPRVPPSKDFHVGQLDHGPLKSDHFQRPGTINVLSLRRRQSRAKLRFDLGERIVCFRSHCLPGGSQPVNFLAAQPLVIRLLITSRENQGHSY